MAQLCLDGGAGVRRVANGRTCTKPRRNNLCGRKVSHRAVSQTKAKELFLLGVSVENCVQCTKAAGKCKESCVVIFSGLGATEN